MPQCFAALAAMVAGGISLGGAKYAEEAGEREAELSLIAEERQQHLAAPDQEFSELVALYEKRGLSHRLAQKVALELSATDALPAHIEAELDIRETTSRSAPVFAAIMSGVSFALGSVIPLLAVLFVPDIFRAYSTLFAVSVSLCLTSWVQARFGHTRVASTFFRSLTIGILTLALTYTGGAVLNL